ncbi:MAG: hypothetical protein JW794_10445 [Candidatus Cloacimonetes bacterium]|nr:hypothetical protein [Candidatus Cloacimonadota bacterium]
MKEKIFFILFILLMITSFCWSLHLNEFEHIVQDDDSEIENYYLDNGIYMVRCDSHTCEGNSLFRTASGYLTMITLEDNVPSVLRLYKNDGMLLFKESYKKIINLILSENKQYFAFFDGKDLVVFDDNASQAERFAGSVVFAIDNEGNPAYFDDADDCFNYKDISIQMDEYPLSTHFLNDKPLIRTRHHIYTIREKYLVSMYSTTNTLFEIHIQDGELYFVERSEIAEGFHFSLKRFNDNASIVTLDGIDFPLSRTKSHETIIAPLNHPTISYPFPIGNSYGEIQQYGGSPYLHPGVDFLGSDYENVYAVKSGYIKAILTTGGSAYWRIGISNENTAAESEGYLYAHLNQNSIPYIVGDSVQAGDVLGTLYPWAVYDFTHIHFGRITCSGATWYGNWWTTDNPLVDMPNVLDTIPPVFENAYGSDLFAFRTESGTYLDPDELIGEIDIIAKCHDIINANWRVDVWDIMFKLHPASNPNATIYERFSFAYDMPLDTYISGMYDNMVLYTIYSRDPYCYSIGDYTNREYYHIITNSNGDSVITEQDQYENLDTSQFPDGQYILEVITRDCSLNETSAYMSITIDNVSIDDEEQHENQKLTIHPNPCHLAANDDICISFTSKKISQSQYVMIYNSKGQYVRKISFQEALDGFVEIFWNGYDEQGTPVQSGIYFIAVVQGQNITDLRKVIILR